MSTNGADGIYGNNEIESTEKYDLKCNFYLILL